MSGVDLEELLQFFYQCPVGLIEIDDRGVVLRINPAAARMLAPALEGEDLTELFGVLERICPAAVRTVTARPERLGPLRTGGRLLARTGPSGRSSIEVRLVRVERGRVMVTLLDATEEVRLAQRAERLATRLREVVAATIAYRQAAARVLGVSATGAAVLEELLNRGTRTPGALARWTGQSSARVTAVLDELEEAGLVQRVPNPHDRRSTLVSLTPAGERRVAPLLDLLVGGVDRAVAGMEDGTDVTEVLGTVTTALRTGTAARRRRRKVAVASEDPAPGRARTD